MTEQALTLGTHTLLGLWPEGEPPQTEVVCFADAEEARRLAAGLPRPAALLAVDGVDWNRELSPWPAEKCFKGGEAFAGEGPAFLHTLTQALLPQAEQAFALHPAKRIIAGYSLGGLFALWVFCECEAFQAAVSASGSLWYDGFDAYLQSCLPARPDAPVYLSLGDAEEKARNPRLAAVGDATRSAYALLQARGYRAVLAWNPGGHFSDPTGRLSRGIGWALEQI